MTDKFVFGVNEFYFIKEVPLGFVFPSSYKKQKKTDRSWEWKFVGLVLFFESIYLHFMLIYLLLIL